VQFGPSVQKHEQHIYEYHQLSCASAQVTGFCFNDLGFRSYSDFVFAVSHTSAFRAKSEGRCPIPTNFIGMPKWYNVRTWYYSEACLYGLTELQLCMDASRHIFIGMLLTYSDGHLESLGQWRPDFATIIVKPTTRFYICCNTLVRGRSYVRHVGLTKEESIALGEVWLDVSVGDTLSWWFTSKQSEVFAQKI
jgi:hypothetical protein